MNDAPKPVERPGFPPLWRCKCGACNYDHATRCWACHGDREKAEVVKTEAVP